MVVNWHCFPDAETQAAALADAVRDALRTAHRASSERATLAVSGGTSPKLFLQTLGRRDLDWTRLDVTLVDDRWVDPADPDSNERLVRTTLLAHAGPSSRFFPLVDAHTRAAARVAALNRAALPALPDVAVLGLGEDGHSASLFADAPEWPMAIRTPDRFVLMHPVSAPHARVSWSLAALRASGRLFLQIGGQAKRAVLDQNLAQPGINAISKIIETPRGALDVYWYA